MTSRSALLGLTFVLTLIFAGLQIAAQSLHFYWIYWWFDWLMHFLAGFTGGLIIFWVLYYFWFWRRWTDKILLPVLTVLICLLLIGIAWEIADVLNITDRHEAVYADDVRNDLIADAVGALLAVFISIKVTILKHG